MKASSLLEWFLSKNYLKGISDVAMQEIEAVQEEEIGFPLRSDKEPMGYA